MSARSAFTLVLTLAAIGALTLLSACGGDDDADSPEADTDEPIVIGVAGARSGFLASFDTDATRGFNLAMGDINGEGGIAGRPVEVEWIDTESDQTRTAEAARELIDQRGADIILTSCDVDGATPAALEAQQSGIVSISYCAGGVSFADKQTLGPDVFTFGQAGDDYGTRDAEWAFNEQGWRRAYVLTDETLEYNSVVERYFEPRWEELGGEVVGKDTFLGVDQPEIGTQVSRLRQAADEVDFVYLNSFGTPAATALRQIRAAGIDLPVFGSGVDGSTGPAFIETSGPVRDYWAGTWACYVDCTGGSTPELEQFLDRYRQEHGTPDAEGHAVIGWDLAWYLKEAIGAADGDTNADVLVETMETMDPVEGFTGAVQFTPDCHKPVGRELPLVRYSGRKAEEVARTAAESIPDIGENNPCRQD